MRIGALLRGGEIIELRSDLGGGKTTITRGIASGAGSKDEVSSPSFTIINTYNTPRFTLQHYDFYRLSEAGIMAEELNESMADPSTVVIVEWGDIVHDLLHKKSIIIKIENFGDDERLISVTAPPQCIYVEEEL